MANVFIELSNALGVHNLKKDRKEFLNAVYSYVVGASWCPCQKQKDLIAAILSTSIKEAAITFNISEKNAVEIMQRASIIIKNAIGQNAIQTAIYGNDQDFENVVSYFMLSTHYVSPDKYLQNNLLEMLPKQSNWSYPISALSEEIKLLNQCTKKALAKKLNQVNTDKTTYIIQVLSSNSPEYAPLRVELFKRIMQ